MTADMSAPGGPTDKQLADMVRYIARVCLEVERGLRPPDHLQALKHPAHRVTPLEIGRFQAGPVQADQIGHPAILRLTDTHLVATVVTRTDHQHWGALSLRLHAKNGRWRITDLQRLLAATHYRTPSPATIQHDQDLAGLTAHHTRGAGAPRR